MSKTSSQIISNVHDDTNDAIRIYQVGGTTGGGGAQTAFYHGAKSSISTSAVQMVVGSNPAAVSVLIRADSENTGIVYVGKNSSVTAGSSDSTDGMPLAANETLTLEINDANKIYLIASAAGQKVYWTAV